MRKNQITNIKVHCKLQNIFMQIYLGLFTFATRILHRLLFIAIKIYCDIYYEYSISP